MRIPVDPNYGISHIEPARPRPFDPSRIKGNTYQCGCVTMVRIPNIEGKISQRSQENKTYIEYIYSTWYDPETRQNRNRKKIIGRYIEDFPGFMIPNESYSLFFDFETGKQLPHPQIDEDGNPLPDQPEGEDETKEPAASPEKPQTQTTQANQTNPKTQTTQTNQITQTTTNTTPMTYDPIKKLAARGRKELVNALLQTQQQQQEEEAKRAMEEAKMSEDEEERRRAEEREQYIAFKEHFELVKDIFQEAYDTIQKQARKSPNAVVSLYTVQRINETIAEIQGLLKDSDVENYIILLDEPKETELGQEEKDNKDNKTTKIKRSAKSQTPKLTGLTFSDVEIIMGQIVSVLHWYELKRIYYSVY